MRFALIVAALFCATTIAPAQTPPSERLGLETAFLDMLRLPSAARTRAAQAVGAFTAILVRANPDKERAILSAMTEMTACKERVLETVFREETTRQVQSMSDEDIRRAIAFVSSPDFPRFEMLNDKADEDSRRDSSPDPNVRAGAHLLTEAERAEMQAIIAAHPEYFSVMKAASWAVVVGNDDHDCAMTMDRTLTQAGVVLAGGGRN